MTAKLLPRLTATDVLIDMNGTLTCLKKHKTKDEKSFLNLLVELMMESKVISKEEALKRIKKVGNPNTTCLFSFLPTLGISRHDYWDKVQQYLSKRIEIAKDAVYLILTLPKRGIRLYSATTNSRMATLSKLAVSGLATIDGSPYFTGFFGGDSFGDPLGKFSPSFFPSIIKETHLKPAKTLMIGDDQEHDLAPALAAGIKQVVLVKRDQKEPFIKKNDGGIYVNSLKWVLKMIED